jgi:hypothetical protein
MDICRYEVFRIFILSVYFAGSLNCSISFNFVSFCKISRNMEFREIASLFSEITDSISHLFHGIFGTEFHWKPYSKISQTKPSALSLQLKEQCTKLGGVVGPTGRCVKIGGELPALQVP